MVSRAIPFVLFFHRGSNPTDAEREAASKIGARVGFRSADQVSDLAFSSLEENDGVAGDVPKRYADNYPSAQSAIDSGQLYRVSDVDRKHGPVTAIDNERARAAKPPSVSQDLMAATAGTRPAGAITAPDGGFVAPRPGNPDSLLSFGSERAENGPEGSNVEGVVTRANPQGLPDTGLALPATGSDPKALSGLVADGGGTDGFTPPKPVEDAAEAGPKGGKAKAGATGGTGASGGTGA